MPEDFLAVLHREHAEMTLTLHRLEAESDPEARAKLALELETRMLPHFLAEEKVICPRLNDDSREGIRQDALRVTAEHDAMRLVLRDVTESPAVQEDFAAKVRVLRELLERHVAEEESELFAALREAVGEEDAQDLMSRYAREKPPCGPTGETR